MLTREYIDASHMVTMHGKTSSIEINTTKEGERQYGEWNEGVLRTYRFSKKDLMFMRTHNAVVLTVYNKTEQLLQQFYKAFSSRRKKRFLRTVDFGDLSHFAKDTDVVRRYLQAIDIAVFGLDRDEDQDLINALRQLAEQSKKIFLVTLNRYGAAVFRGSSMWGIPGHDVQVVDTTGAGDSFLAGFLVTYLKTKDVQRSLETGSDVAARVIQKVGAY